jgi:gluconokinase
VIILVMGVAGAGKTTVGRRLAGVLGFEFADADSFHTPASVEKMRRGVPLDDADRAPWLASLAAAVDTWLDAGEDVVLACSALKSAYREQLLRDRSRMAIVYLEVPPGVARARLDARAGHFMPSRLVDSQFQTLEAPMDALRVDATQPLRIVVQQLVEALRGSSAT